MRDDPDRFTNLIRYGTVDSVRGRVARVQLGGVLTPPLRWLTSRAGDTRHWCPPVKGEQVAVLSPGGNIAAGIIIGSLSCTAFPEPDQALPETVVTQYADGAVIVYNSTEHTLNAVLPEGGCVSLIAPGGVRITGDVLIEGALHTTQDVRSDGDIQAGDISLRKHKTQGIQPGSGVSGEPIA